MRISCFVAFFDPFGTVPGTFLIFKKTTKNYREQRRCQTNFLLWPDANRRLVGVWDNVDALRLDWIKIGVRLANLLLYFY
jgi:hypothetical protein